LRLVSLTVARHDGVVMLADANARIAMGDKVLVRGDSGSGKSSLIRAIAGLWPWGTGHIVSPLAGRRIAFMPQRPYLPLGSLRMALLYPRDGARVDDVDIKRALVDCGLAHLLPRLDEEQNWSNILSGGELQRLAFARTFLKNPDVIIMDEATSALDETSQRKMMDMMTSRQAHSMVVHVAHRPGLERYHSRELVLTRDRDMPARLSEPDKTIQYVEARSSTRPRRANSPDVTSTVAAIISDARKPNPALLELDEAPVPRRALARG
jgi:putative ATP-binding cassette transporter